MADISIGVYAKQTDVNIGVDNYAFPYDTPLDEAITYISAMSG